MSKEIERKFFVKDLPDLSGIVQLRYERYFLERENGVEVRISKVNDACFYEKKIEVSHLERTREKREISVEEFAQWKKKASEAIVRDRYNISTNPDIAIQVYHGRFEGLIRAEVEFKTEDDAQLFVPLDWMDKEMTGLPVARDSRLIELSDDQLRMYLK